MNILLRNPTPLRMLMGLDGLTLICVALLVLNNTIRGENILPEPGPRTLSSSYPPNLDQYLAKVLESETKERQEFQVLLQERDFDYLRDHIINIGAQRRWLTHNPSTYSIEIVLPESQLHEIQHLKRDPTSWLESARKAPPETRTPTPPVNVKIKFKDPIFLSKLLKALGATAALLTGALLLSVAIIYRTFIKQTPLQRRPGLTDATQH